MLELAGQRQADNSLAPYTYRTHRKQLRLNCACPRQPVLPCWEKQLGGLFGDNVRAATLKGDGFRSLHDLVKNFLFRQLRAVGVPTECEVFNLFARELLQEGLSRIEKGRTRQTMVPDIKISIPEAGGRSEQRLFEMKVLSSCLTRYPRNPRPEGRSVDNR